MAKELNAGAVIDSMFVLAENVRKLGVEKVAEVAGVQARVVRKFLNDMMASKNSDIKKIRDAVTSLIPPASPEKDKAE